MPKPTNQKLYDKVKAEAKKRFKVWPSAYASGWLVKEYKRRGGRYEGSSKVGSRKQSRKVTRKQSKKVTRKQSKATRKQSRKQSRKSRKSTRSGIGRWFRERWINVCKLPKIVDCGRRKADMKNYPYCRPLYRITSGTPRTAREIPKEEIKRRCKRKRASPMKRIMPKKLSSKRGSKRGSKGNKKLGSKRNHKK